MKISAADEDRWFRSVTSKDPRFDGWVFVGVTSTGIYCRPSCPANTPKRENMRFFTASAAAQGAGFRACKRCRPDATPGSPAWNYRADVVGRAMRLIVDGLVDREGVKGLAGQLGYSERHLHRLLVNEVGAGPIALARAQRAQNARLLIETTTLTFSDIAYAAGFSSIRQFNDVVKVVFAQTPGELRRKRQGSSTTSGVAPTPESNGVSTLSIRLPFRAPFAGRELFEFLSARRVSGVESCSPAEAPVYERSLRLSYGLATCRLEIGTEAVTGTFHLQDLRDMASAVNRSRRLLDLDSDPVAVIEAFEGDPLLGELVRKTPGLRVPGHVDGFEVAVRAIVGQQVSVAGARTTLGKIANMHGEELPSALGARSPDISRVFPSAETMADVNPDQLGVPKARGATIVRIARAFAEGRICVDPGSDADDAAAALLGEKGIGPWTASYVRLRSFGDPDCFLPTDLGVKHAFTANQLPIDERSIDRVAAAWRPWRSYALMYLWHSLA